MGEASIGANPVPYCMAMIEAMDTEIGRLLRSMTQEIKLCNLSKK